MPFADSITIERLEPIWHKPDAPAAARLAVFTTEQAAEFIPVSEDDPSLQFLPPACRREFQLDPAEFTRRYMNDLGSISWGVHVEDELAGVAALRPHERGATCVELFLAPKFRGQRVGELALAGTMSAAFTPGYLESHAPHLWRALPPDLEVEIHRDNLPSKRLAQRFGFGYRTHRLMTGTAFSVNVYRAHPEMPQGHGLADQRIRTFTRSARFMLSGFNVVSQGEVAITDLPDATQG
jgi:RimJ/RimL family protein N-acetyltransferase